MLRWLVNRLWQKVPDPTEAYRRMMRNAGHAVVIDNGGLAEAVAIIPIDLIGGPYDGSQFPMPAPLFGIEDELTVPISKTERTAAFYQRPSLDSHVAHFVHSGYMQAEAKTDTD